jgi:U3 small nucleolar RNA-associated protein 18
MPTTGLKEKTKRTTTRSPLENNTANLRPEDSDIEMDEDTSSDEEDIPEKDEAELKLERMLFGDDEGFMGALKKQQDREAGMALTLQSDDESAAGESADEDEGEDLAAMADSDVCDTNPMLPPLSGLQSNNPTFV